MRNVSVAIIVSLVVAGCGGGGGGSSNTTASATAQASKLPVITMSVSRSQINVTQSSLLTWSVTDATSCTGSKGLSGSLPLTGNKIITYVEGDQSLEISCTGNGGTSSKAVTVVGKQPALTFAGAWYPVASQSLSDDYDGTIVGSFINFVKIGQKVGLALTGWGYKGWSSTSKETATVRLALFEPDSNGLMTLATDKYISDPNNYGGASVISTDVNKDSYQDIVLISHNETPILPNPSIVYYGSASGNFTKRTTSDRLSAHDARLITVDGKEKILTGVVTGHPRNAYYQFVNGDLNPTYTPSISYYNTNFLQLGNMSQTIVENKQGVKALVTGGGCRDATGFCNKSINTFAFDGYDISQQKPLQTITPYLSTLPRYVNVVSEDGAGQTHVYRVWSLDLNNDGNSDVLSAQSMWMANSDQFPVALQVLQNQGNNTFVDRTEVLNSEMSTNQNTLDPTPMFIDIDNSGIKTLFFNMQSMSNTNKHTNYVLLNDGTGKLYVALHREFETVVNDMFAMLTSQGYKFPISNPTLTWQMPKFIVVPQTDGSVNYLAEIRTTARNKDNGMTQAVHLFINVPFSYNPKTDFVKNISVADRNNSNKIRTWAGDDTINDTNAVVGTRIDGGLGKNKVTYNGASTNYNVTKNNDGTYRVTSSANNIDDTLVRIHNIVFTDKTITLE